MSRSNPTENKNPHPCSRWYEWKGGEGHIQYYDKEAEKAITLPDGFTFIYLDTTAAIRGWHNDSESGIYSNEVRDLRGEILLVKSFKGGVIAEGLYSQISDHVSREGGRYTSNVYLAYKADNGELALGCLQLKGAGLMSWIKFANDNRKELLTKAVQIKGWTEGKKGKVVFRAPNFRLIALSPETNEKAVEIDRALQAYFSDYFSRNKAAQAQQPAPATPSAPHPEPPTRSNPPDDPADDIAPDDIPF